MPADLDQSGNGYQVARTWLGPTLGWVMTQVHPERRITAPGAYAILPGDSVIFSTAAGGPVSLGLPDVRVWIQEAAYQPATAFERSIWIKDLGGNASSVNPITVVPFGTQTIDALAQAFQIIQARQLLRLYPLNDLSGWFSG